MRKIIIVFFLILSNLYFSQAIENPNNIISPNAASIGKFGDIQMNLYTGRANVAVPIFNISEKGIPLNINLAYDTGGVKVSEMPSWVGQNWTLNTGGVISRSIKGLPDEYYEDDPTLQSVNNSNYNGYYYHTEIINGSNWTNSQDGILPDVQPDVFSFNMNGLSGKFFLGNDRKWKVQSDDNIKVIINMNDNIPSLGYSSYPNVGGHTIHTGYLMPKYLGKITLIDGNGTQYVFGGNLNSIEYSVRDFFNQDSSPVFPVSWNLTKVVDKDGNAIYEYEYEKGNFEAQFFLDRSYTRIKQDPNHLSFWSSCSNSCEFSISSFGSNAQLIRTSYLKKIKTIEGNEIVFNRSLSNYKTFQQSNPDIKSGFTTKFNEMGLVLKFKFWYLTHNEDGTYKSDVFGDLTNLDYGNYIDRLISQTKPYVLNNIVIKTKNDQQGKLIEFNHNADTNERLNLEKVQNTFDKTEYSFQYNSFSSLPNFVSRAQDHWGYYKGSDMIMNTLNDDSFFNSFYSSREPNPQYLEIGTLKKITYPTKGWTEFSYEPHNYAKYIKENLSLAGEESISGGVRIKSIVNNDGNGNLLTKNYKYTSERNSNLSSGILNIKNKYFYPEWKVNTLYEYRNGVGASSGYYHEKNFNLNTLIPQINFSGSHIGYSKVFEYDNRGYIEYNFTDFADYPDLPFNTTVSREHSIFEDRTSNDFLRGKEKSKIVYDAQGSIVSKIISTYSKIGLYNLFNARSKAYQSVMVCPYLGSACMDLNIHIFGSTYYLPYYDFKITNQLEENWFGTNKITTNKSYEYYNDPENQFTLVKKENISSNDDLLSNEFTYPHDQVGTIYTEMINNFLTDRPIVIQQKKNGKTLEKASYLFDKLSSTSNKIKLTKLYNYDINDGAVKSTTSYNLYDTKGNLLELQPQTLQPTTYIWGYNQTKIIAKIEGAKYSEVMQAFQLDPNNNSSYLDLDIVKKSNSDINETTEDDLMNYFKQFKSKQELQNYLITTYAYDPISGIKTIIPPSGIEEYYKYDSSNRLEKIQDVNGKIIKEFKYNYVPTKYFNIVRSQSFTRNNCGLNYVGADYTYTVPANTYFSYVSQTDADQKAIDDIDLNGQNAANQNAVCIPILSCNFIFSPYLGNPFFTNNTTISILNTVTFNVVFSGYELVQPWSSGVNIGKVGADCVPMTSKEIIYFETSNNANRQWKISIDTVGNCIVKLLSGTIDPNSYSPIVFQLQYQK